MEIDDKFMVLDGKKVTYDGYDLTVSVEGTYKNGRIAIRLRMKDWEPYTNMTINLPTYDLVDNEIFINDQNAEKGLLDALVKGGIVEDTGERKQSGYVTYPKARLILE